MPKLKPLQLQDAGYSLPESATAYCLVMANHVRHQLPRQPLVRGGGLEGNQAPNRAQSILFAALCLVLGLQ